MSVGFVIAFVSHLGVRPEPGEILRMQLFPCINMYYVLLSDFMG